MFPLVLAVPAGLFEEHHEVASCARPDMLMCMRTTIDIPDALAAEVRERLARQGRTLRAVVIESLRMTLSRPPGAFTLQDAAFTGSTGFVGGVGPESALADMRDDPAGRGPAIL